MVNQQKSGSNFIGYLKSSIVILLFLLSFLLPYIGFLAIILMWFLTKWPKWLKMILTIIPILLITVSTLLAYSYLFFARPFKVSGNAMSPTYKNDVYLATKLYHPNQDTLQRGDIIILQSPQNPSQDLIERVIGLPGEAILLQNGDVYINGQKLDESKYLSSDTKTTGGAFLGDGQTITVPSKQYFVLGDNRLNSSDSRQWGFAPDANLISKISFCYWNCK